MRQTVDTINKTITLVCTVTLVAFLAAISWGIWDAVNGIGAEIPESQIETIVHPYEGLTEIQIAEMKDEEKRAAYHARILWAILRWGLNVGVASLFILIVIWVSMKAKHLIDAPRTIKADRHGNYPIAVENYTHKDEYGHKVRERGYVNLDTTLSDRVVVSKNGSLRIDAPLDADPNIHLMAQRQRRESMVGPYAPNARGVPGRVPSRNRNRAETEFDAGIPFAKKQSLDLSNEIKRMRLENERARAQERARQASQPEVIEPVYSFEPMPIDRAFKSGNYESIAYAQRITDSRLMFWSPLEQANIRIHGEPNSGKSYIALFILAQMICRGWNVVALDAMRMKDYKPIERHVQFIDTEDPETFLAALKSIEHEYERRKIMLAEGDARDITKLARAPRRMCVLIDEFSDQMLNCDDINRGYEAINQIGKLVSKCRATGIHFLLIDQFPQANFWTGRTRASVSFVIQGNFPQGSRLQSGIEVYDKLGLYEFLVTKTRDVVKGWDCEDFIVNTLGTIQPGNPNYIDLAGNSPIDLSEIYGAGEKFSMVAKYMMDNPDEGPAKVARACNASATLVKNVRSKLTELGAI